MKESLAECVQRWQRESGLKPLEASQRAKKRGHKVSQDYIEDLASGAQVNPSPRIMKAVAAGFGKPVEEIVAAAMGWSAAEADQINGLIREIGEAYKQLSPAKQKDKRPLLEMINRELQREL